MYNSDLNLQTQRRLLYSTQIRSQIACVVFIILNVAALNCTVLTICIHTLTNLQERFQN